MRLIDADALINSLKKDWPQTSKITWAQIVAKCAPTIDAEPVKHGSWTITDTDDGEGGEIPHLICSECKSEPMAWSSKRFFNYCPNCGAKMKGIAGK